MSRYCSKIMTLSSSGKIPRPMRPEFLSSAPFRECFVVLEACSWQRHWVAILRSQCSSNRVNELYSPMFCRKGTGRACLRRGSASVTFISHAMPRARSDTRTVAEKPSSPAQSSTPCPVASFDSGQLSSQRILRRTPLLHINTKPTPLNQMLIKKRIPLVPHMLNLMRASMTKRTAIRQPLRTPTSQPSKSSRLVFEN